MANQACGWELVTVESLVGPQLTGQTLGRVGRTRTGNTPEERGLVLQKLARVRIGSRPEAESAAVGSRQGWKCRLEIGAPPSRTTRRRGRPGAAGPPKGVYCY